MSNSQARQAQLFQERFGLKVAARLSDASDLLPHDISERLRHARMKAVSVRKRTSVQSAQMVLPSGNGAVIGGPGLGLNWWQRMGAVLPVLALLFGLIAINAALDDRAAQEIANVDAALLVDDLPPAAYADPGFSQFLKMQRAQTR